MPSLVEIGGTVWKFMKNKHIHFYIRILDTSICIKNEFCPDSLFNYIEFKESVCEFIKQLGNTGLNNESYAILLLNIHLERKLTGFGAALQCFPE
jgi:hypothetical protein